MSTPLTFDSARRGWATTMLCQLRKEYFHDHANHFAYLTQSEGTWQFAELRAADIQNIMATIAPAEAAQVDTVEPGEAAQELFQACVKCCGLKVHGRPFAFVKQMDGDYVGPAVPNNQFKKCSNRTLKSEANDNAVGNLFGPCGKKSWHGNIAAH